MERHLDQQNWFDLKDKLGNKEARKHLVNELRKAADQVEKGGYPDVFGCQLKPEPDPKWGEPFIWTISVTLSYPWPG
jgi:hypothetical protein